MNLQKKLTILAIMAVFLLFSIQSVLAYSYSYSYNNTQSYSYSNTQTYGYNNTNTYTNTYTNTQTCTYNGVQVDCVTREPINSGGSSQSDLCPALNGDFQYGRNCTYKVKNLEYKAVKITQSYSGSYFPGGAKLEKIGHMNDAYKLVGQSIGYDGRKYGVELQLSDNVTNVYFTLLGSYGLTSQGGGVDNYGNVVGSTQFAWNAHEKSASFTGSGSSYYPTSATIYGNSGFLNDVKSARNPYPIQHRVGTEKMSDSMERGVYWSDNGYPSSSYFWKKAMLGSTGDKSSANAVNASGKAAGEIKLSNSTVSKAVQWNPRSNSYVSLSGLGGDAAAIDLNNNKTPILVGYVKNYAGTQKAAKWKGTSLTQMPSISGMGNPNDKAHAITDAGDIVGESRGSAVIWRDGKVHNLNSILSNNINVSLEVAEQINRQGLIIALADDGYYYVLLPTDHL